MKEYKACEGPDYISYVGYLAQIVWGFLTLLQLIRMQRSSELLQRQCSTQTLNPVARHDTREDLTTQYDPSLVVWFSSDTVDDGLCLASLEG
jgi:hypothetical protein